jgi:hypothetical protein
MQKAPFLVVFTLAIVIAALFVTLLGQDLMAARSTDNRTYATESPRK